MARLASLALTLVLATGCTGGGGGHPDEDLAGLVHADRPAPRPIVAAQAAREVGELLRALGQGDSAVAFAHHMSGTSSLTVRENGTVVEQLAITSEIEVDDQGRYHARLDNSKAYGRDVYWVGGALYLRPRFGKFHRRAPADQAEPSRIRDEIGGDLAGYTELVASSLALADRGARKVAGHDARRIELSLASAPSPPIATSPEKAWRATIVVSKLTGEIALDEQSGVALAGKLEAELSFVRAGHHYALAVTVDHAIATSGTPVVAPTDDQVQTGIEQPTELEERESLLQGIAPPATRAPTPKNPQGVPDDREGG